MNAQTTTTQINEISRGEEAKFRQEVDRLIEAAENSRLDFMRRYRGRHFLSLSVGLFIIVLGGSGFGWFLLMEANIIKAVASMAIAIAIPLFIYLWSEQPLKAYKRYYKNEFMKRMAHLLGGLKFHPYRGISAKILPKTGIIPAHDVYRAEDCFMGKYKGVKVLFSEARLTKKQNSLEPVFDGVFVLLEAPQKVFEGHTIITADKPMIRQYRDTRWKKLEPVTLDVGEAYQERFDVFSDKPDKAATFIHDPLLKELSEAADIFDKSPLTAVLFKGKYIFMAIPYEKDMFEASSIYLPVAMRDQAMTCKKEINQILEVIDVFEVFSAGNNPKNPQPAETP